MKKENVPGDTTKSEKFTKRETLKEQFYRKESIDINGKQLLTLMSGEKPRKEILSWIGEGKKRSEKNKVQTLEEAG